MSPAEHPSDTDAARNDVRDDSGTAGSTPPDAAREQVGLTDGTTVEVRSVGSGDAEALAAGYQQLRATSAYQRFFTIYPDLSPQQARTLRAEYLSENPALPALLRRFGTVHTDISGTTSTAVLDLAS